MTCTQLPTIPICYILMPNIAYSSGKLHLNAAIPFFLTIFFAFIFCGTIETASHFDTPSCYLPLDILLIDLQSFSSSRSSITCTIWSMTARSFNLLKTTFPILLKVIALLALAPFAQSHALLPVLLAAAGNIPYTFVVYRLFCSGIIHKNSCVVILLLPSLLWHHRHSLMHCCSLAEFLALASIARSHALLTSHCLLCSSITDMVSRIVALLLPVLLWIHRYNLRYALSPSALSSRPHNMTILKAFPLLALVASAECRNDCLLLCECQFEKYHPSCTGIICRVPSTLSPSLRMRICRLLPFPLWYHLQSAIITLACITNTSQDKHQKSPVLAIKKYERPHLKPRNLGIAITLSCSVSTRKHALQDSAD